MELIIQTDKKVEVNKEDFLEYESIRRGGKYNMLDPMARKISGLSKDQWIAILKNYDDLYQAYIEEYLHDEGPDEVYED
tara:strand:- start:658 stop:894 length:237 start_codon:yes stop_codon:yes gene_type:complete